MRVAFEVFNKVRHLYKRDPKRDPYLENYPVGKLP